MTVERYAVRNPLDDDQDVQDYVWCQWFKGGTQERAKFPEVSLQPAKVEKK
jgi:uncharacterized protein YodC (DUF2158 family)